jgi:hypothetical protein
LLNDVIVESNASPLLPLSEGDIDLLAHDEHWDIHAIAGLLKWYFRDLPISVLDEQQTAFVQTMGMTSCWTFACCAS